MYNSCELLLLLSFFQLVFLRNKLKLNLLVIFTQPADPADPVDPMSELFKGKFEVDDGQPYICVNYFYNFTINQIKSKVEMATPPSNSQLVKRKIELLENLINKKQKVMNKIKQLNSQYPQAKTKNQNSSSISATQAHQNSESNENMLNYQQRKLGLSQYHQTIVLKINQIKVQQKLKDLKEIKNKIQPHQADLLKEIDQEIEIAECNQYLTIKKLKVYQQAKQFIKVCDQLQQPSQNIALSDFKKVNERKNIQKIQQGPTQQQIQQTHSSRKLQSQEGSKKYNIKKKDMKNRLEPIQQLRPKQSRSHIISQRSLFSFSDSNLNSKNEKNLPFENQKVQLTEQQSLNLGLNVRSENSSHIQSSMKGQAIGQFSDYEQELKLNQSTMKDQAIGQFSDQEQDRKVKQSSMKGQAIRQFSDYEQERKVKQSSRFWLLKRLWTHQPCGGLPYKILGQIGTGSFGNVYRGVSSINQQFALKIHSLQKLQRLYKKSSYLKAAQLQQRKDQFRKRAAKHILIEHPNIVKAYQFMMMDREKYCVTVFELCQGTLSSWIGTADKQAQLIMMQKISSGLKYLHDQGIIHHNLYPQHILLKNGEPKIADLEGSVFLKAINGRYEQDNGGLWGEMDYLAPEVFRQEKYGKEADVWSMGVMFFQILTGKRIRQMRKEGLIETAPGMIKGFFQKIKTMIPNDSQRILIEKMLNEQADYRLDSKSIQQQVNEMLRKEHANQINQLKPDQRTEINGMNQDQFIDQISRNLIFTECKAIILNHNQITDAGLEALAVDGHKFPQLQTINLFNNEITDAGLKALAVDGHKFPQLQTIDLGNNKITDAGLEALAVNGHKFPQLQTIDLRNNKITDAGLEALAENGHKLPQLKIINLAVNQITDAGLKQCAAEKFKFKISL